MRRIFQSDRNVAENRFLHANIILVGITCLLLFRLWYVQIYRGDYYKRISENNRIQYIEIPAPRGIVFDRNGEVVLGNRPYFDLVYVPQFILDKEMTFQLLSRLLHVPIHVFEKRLWMARGLPKYLPIPLKRNLTLHEVATIESNKIFLPGIDIAVAPRRDYKPGTPSHMVGYLGEISAQELKNNNKEDPHNLYRAGDLVGKQGLESRWEKYLRGKRGNKLIQVDAFGRRAELLEKSMQLPEVAAVPGNDLVLTLDSALQSVTREAFKGKNGAVVVLDPRNGEIYAMVSEPGYDPNIYQGVLSPEKYRSLVSNPFKPFLDKTTGGSFIPGSVYKAVVAIAALEEKVVTANTSFFCPGHYTLGGQVFHCHDRAGHGTVNLRRALMKSCDVYFYNIGVELGVDRIAKYAEMLGLGQKLGVGLNFEMPGLVPTSAWKRLTYRAPWTTGETPSISIGQGANQMTPVQMATLYATIGNEGKIWRPHLVKKVINHLGETLLVQDPELIRKIDSIKKETFRLVKEGLAAVVMDKEGTGKNAAVEGETVAGKTGSVQVVSLSKNLTKLDVSMKWREHAMFAAFSPVDNPEIAVAVVSEHDEIGGGGKSAAPIAGKIIAAFYDLKKRRQGMTAIGMPAIKLPKTENDRNAAGVTQ
jgi:penicillin-binding protein 2